MNVAELWELCLKVLTLSQKEYLLKMEGSLPKRITNNITISFMDKIFIKSLSYQYPSLQKKVFQEELAEKRKKEREKYLYLCDSYDSSSWEL